MSFLCLYGYLWTDFTHGSGVSILDFEKVNFNRELFQERTNNIYIVTSHLNNLKKHQEACLSKESEFDIVEQWFFD